MAVDIKVLKSDALLLLTAAIWGGGFVAQRIGMESVGPLTFNATRFALGSLSIVPVMLLRSRWRQRHEGEGERPALGTTLRWSAVAGLVLFLGATLQQAGIVYTTAGKAGFITGFYVVIVPMMGLLWRQRPDAATWGGAVLALAGLYLLSATEDATMSYGDLLVFIGAFFWAMHVLVIGRVSSQVDPLLLSSLQFAVCAVLSLVGAMATETMELAGIFKATPAILYGGLISVGVAFTCQVFGQKDAHPAHAAIILNLESVFAALYGWLLLGETLGGRAILGCACMLVGMLLSQMSLFVTWSKRSKASAASR